MDERADYQQQANEEAAYIHALMTFRQLLEEYGTEQVEYDLNRLATEFEVHIEKHKQREFKTLNLF